MRKVYGFMLAVGILAGAPLGLSGAVFTDQASIDSNSFTSGTVDISTSPASALVSYSDMAPGSSTTQSLTVANDGSLAMRYAVTSTATNADSKAVKDQLALIIKTVDLTTPGTPCDDFDGTQLYSGDMDSTAGKLVGDSTQGADSGDRGLNGGSSEVLCFQVSLPSSTGNAHQGAATAVTFGFASEQTANN